jgi:hypothetical protein
LIDEFGLEEQTVCNRTGIRMVTCDGNIEPSPN